MPTRIIDPRLCLAAAAVLIAGGCTKHTIEVKPIKVEPIHMTLDINIRVDRELDEFFAFEKQYDQATPASNPETSSTAPVGEGGTS